MARLKTLPKQKESSKTSKSKAKKTVTKPYDPSKELLDTELIAKAFMECFSNASSI
jgi:hypothetical protein